MYSVRVSVEPISYAVTPFIERLTVAPCIIREVRIVVPGGCADLVYAWVDYRASRLFPVNDDGFFYGNNTIIVFQPNVRIDEPPYELEIKMINTDDWYAHAFTFYFDVDFIEQNEEVSKEYMTIYELAALYTRK